MTAKEIFESHLLLDKKISLSFTSRNDAATIHSLLRVYKHRYVKQLDSLGMAEFSMLDGRVIAMEITHSDSFSTTAIYSLSAPKPRAKTQFTILDISENQGDGTTE